MKTTEIALHKDGSISAKRGEKIYNGGFENLRDWIRAQIREEQCQLKEPVNSNHLNPLSILAARVESMEYVLIQGGSGLEIYDPGREVFLPIVFAHVPHGTTSVQLDCRELTLTVGFSSNNEAMAVSSAVWHFDHPTVARKSA